METKVQGATLRIPGSWLEKDASGSSRRLSFFKCYCGKIFCSRVYRKFKSCGCLQKKIAAVTCGNNFRTHGRRRTPEYTVWHRAKQRCTDPKDAAFLYYGGRGIKFCDRWMDSFENFLADMGPRPSPKHSLERDDNDKGYGPDNCRWATRIEQANNKRNNVFIQFDGMTMTAPQWERHLGLPHGMVKTRLCRGWSVERALTQSPRT